MKIRVLTGLTVLAIASPAYAHHEASNAASVQTLMHWLANPVHALPIIAALALTGFVMYSRKQRG